MKTLTREIELTQGQVAIVDDEDYDRLSAFKWQAHFDPKMRGYYATSGSLYKLTGVASMSRVITQAPKGTHVDHINHDTLDNRKENLRVCTVSENMRNKKRHIDNTSGYKGVCWRKDHSKWHAQIQLNKKVISLGFYTNILTAAAAYDCAATKYHGEFAYRNFPEKSPTNNGRNS